MTEDDARTKYCCGPVGCGDYPEGTPKQAAEAVSGQLEYAAMLTVAPRVCVGSNCMAWRWERVPNPAFRDYVKGQGGYMMISSSRRLIYAPPAEIRSTTDGYCGRGGSL